MRYTRSPGFTIIELMAVILMTTVLLCFVLPVVARGRSLSGLDQSLSNLMALGFAHAIYAADYDGRQVTLVVDNLASYGHLSEGDFTTPLNNYNSRHEPNHPNIYAGWDEGAVGTVGHYAYFLDGAVPAHSWSTIPIFFYGSPSSPIYGFGHFRFRNCEAFHTYVDGRWYGQTFYAPNDAVTYDCAEEAFDAPYSYVHYTHLTCAYPVAHASYCFSPAALFHPDVLRHNVAEGAYFTDPWVMDHGMNTPGFYQTRYPDLKTHIIEHHWNQNAPLDRCNPGFEGGTYGGCEPYYFNHGLPSEPASLFYDLSVRLLPNTEALAADEHLMKQSGHGTWSRDTPMGEFGYFGEFSHDGLVLSHHIFTIDGILGRDTLHGIEPQPAGSIVVPRRVTPARQHQTRASAPGTSRLAAPLVEFE